MYPSYQEPHYYYWTFLIDTIVNYIDIADPCLAAVAATRAAYGHIDLPALIILLPSETAYQNRAAGGALREVTTAANCAAFELCWKQQTEVYCGSECSPHSADSTLAETPGVTPP